MDNNISDMINSIESGTFADAEKIFNDVMDLKVGQQLDQMRQDMAATIFGDESETMDETDDFDHYEVVEDDDLSSEEIEGFDSDENI